MDLDPNLIDKMRRFAAGDEGDEGAEEGGIGKFSPEELAAGRELVKTMEPEILDALLQLPEEELESLIAEQLKKSGVEDVDVPDIIDIIRDIRDERGGETSPSPEMPGVEDGPPGG